VPQARGVPRKLALGLALAREESVAIVVG